MKLNGTNVKLIGTGIAVIGFIVQMVQKQLDDKKLESLVQKEVAKEIQKIVNQK